MHTCMRVCACVVVVVNKMMEWASKTQQSFRLPPASRRCNKAHRHVTCTYKHTCMHIPARECVCVCVAMQRYSKCKAGACAQKGDSNRSCDWCWYWDGDCDCDDCDSDGQYDSLCPLPKCMQKLPPRLDRVLCFVVVATHQALPPKLPEKNTTMRLKATAQRN